MGAARATKVRMYAQSEGERPGTARRPVGRHSYAGGRTFGWPSVFARTPFEIDPVRGRGDNTAAVAAADFELAR